MAQAAIHSSAVWSLKADEIAGYVSGENIAECKESSQIHHPAMTLSSGESRSSN
jgi:hypothetical protein